MADSRAVPRYLQLRNDLTREIRGGRYHPHQQIPSIAELMERYAVSDGTVKRVLRDLQQAGLIYSRSGKGCFVSALSIAADHGRDRVVALVYGRKADEIGENLFFSGVLKGIEQELCGHDLGLELINLQRVRLPDLVAARRRGALALALVFSKLHLDDMKTLVSSGSGTVSVFVEYAPIDGLTCVVSDEFEASRTAASHLIECGCRTIGAIQVLQPVSYAELRLCGFREAVEAWRPDFDDTLIEFGSWTMDSGYLAMKRLLERHPELDGVFAANDMMALGALAAAAESGRRVPEDLKLIGYDDIEIAAAYRPSLTTMHVDRESMGRRAVRALLRKLDAPDREFIVERSLPALVVRQTTRG